MSFVDLKYASSNDYSDFERMALDFIKDRVGIPDPEYAIKSVWLKSFMHQENTAIRIIRKDGTPVGFYALQRHGFGFHGEWLYITSLYVCPEHRREGYGRLMLEDAIKIAKISGLRLYWETSRENFAARALYDQYAVVNVNDVMYTLASQ